MRQKSPQQADKILDAAAELFARHRFHEARMEDLAAAAGVGKGTLYRYFHDKEALYLALLDRAAQGLNERVFQGLGKTDCPTERLLAFTEAIIDYFDANPHLFDLIQHAEAMQRPGQEFPWQKTRNKTITLVKDILHAGRDAGLFAFDDAELAVLMLLGGLRAVLRFGSRPRSPDIAKQIVAGFLAGHGVRAGQQRKGTP